MNSIKGEDFVYKVLCTAKGHSVIGGLICYFAGPEALRFVLSSSCYFTAFTEPLFQTRHLSGKNYYSSLPNNKWKIACIIVCWP